MTAQEALDRVLRSYRRYYDVATELVEAPFAAQATFHSHEERFFLVKKAVLSESESNEYVFFAAEGDLDLARAQYLDDSAWRLGMECVDPHANHKNSDVSLVVIADRISPEAKQFFRKLRRSKNYRWGLYGYSNYRVVAIELSTGDLAANRLGKDLRKLFRNIKGNL